MLNITITKIMKTEETTQQGQREIAAQVSGLMRRIIGGAFAAESDADPRPWLEFRQQITDNPKMKPFLSDADFLHGFSVMNKVTDRLLRIYHSENHEQEMDWDFGPYLVTDRGDELYFNCAESIPYIILGAQAASDCDEHDAWTIRENLTGFLKLREAFDLLSSEDFSGPFHHNEAKVLMDVIVWCLEKILKAIEQLKAS